MVRDPRYDILFETVPIGPLTAKNRFIQTPHCSGMGHARPKAMAEMRRIKAQGGWAIVCTEAAEIHPNSEHTPESVARLWDDGDIPALALAADAIHEHGALAGIELEHSGHYPANHFSRLAPMAASNLCVDSYAPVQARAMDLEDFRELRDWHRTAALRSKQAGFDVIYIYAARPFALPGQLISRRFNDRTDEYGGSIENRARLIRELIDDTKDAVGDRCAIAVRFSVVELLSLDGDPDQETMSSEREGREVLEFLAELPDLWDVIVARLVHRIGDKPICRGRLPGEVHFVRKIGHVQAGRRRGSVHVAGTPWSRRSREAFSTSSARRGPRSPIPSCRKRSKRAGLMKFGSASAAMSVSPQT